jgi:hypothetical protein
MPVEGIDSFVSMKLNWIVERDAPLGLSTAGSARGKASYGDGSRKTDRRSR